MIAIHPVLNLGVALVLAVGASPQNKRSSARIGDLAVTVTELLEEEPDRADDFHVVAVGVRIENLGKRAVCEYFSPKLTTSFDLEYRTTLFGRNLKEPNVRDLLPGETTEGHYSFRVKNGVKPVELTLKDSGDQTCGSARRSGGFATSYRIEHRFSLIQFWRIAEQAESSDDPAQAASPRASPERNKVFVTDTRYLSQSTGAGRPAEASVLKSFAERCPRLTVTLDRNKAEYIVVPDQAGLSRSKNSVVVFRSAGEMIHSGETFTIKNAVKDACNAILQDRSVPR